MQICLLSVQSVDKYSLYTVYTKYGELLLKMGRKWTDFLNGTECKIVND